MVRRGDCRVPTIPDDVDYLCLGVDLSDLLYRLRGEQRRLVARDPLAGLGELTHEEVVDSHAGQVGQVLVRIVVPAPDRPLDPEPQVFCVQHRVVERAGGGRRTYLRFTLSCRQLAPKKRPSPLQSISGWESRIRINHVVPDFCWPRTKNTGVPLTTGLCGSPSPRTRASSLLSVAISPSLTAICLRACLVVFDRKAPVAAFRNAFAPRSASKILRLPKTIT